MNYQVDNFLNIIRYAIHESDVQEIPTLLEPVDWEAMEELAKSHNLFALFHEVAYKFQEYRESPRYEKNTQIAMSIVAKQIQRTETFLELYRAFLKEDLHPIVMKGIICRQLYGKYAEHRPSGDEDILVKKEEFYKVKAFLEKQGYKCEGSEVTEAQLNQAEHVAFRSTDGFSVEVHINLMGRRNDLRMQMGKNFKDVFENSQVRDVKSVPITMLSHTKHYLYLIMHAFKHFIGSGVGIRQMLDILMYQEHYEKEIDWNEVKNALTECHMNGYLGDIQYIGKQYLGFEFENQFLSCCPDVLLNDTMTVGAFGKRDRADLIATNITAGALDQKKRGIRTLLRAGFPTRKQMAEWTPYLNEKPWMLPVEWVKRWGRYFQRTRNYNGNLMKESYKRSRERMELLKKYGL